MTYRVIGLLFLEFLPLLNDFLLVSQCFCFLKYKYQRTPRWAVSFVAHAMAKKRAKMGRFSS